MRTLRVAFLVSLLPVLGALAGVAKPITISVYPQVATTNGYHQQTFRVRISIPKNKDNRLMSYSASCGSEIKTSEREIDRITYEWFEDFTVVENCIFQACLHRAEAGKVKNYCDYQAVTTDALFDPP